MLCVGNNYDNTENMHKIPCCSEVNHVIFEKPMTEVTTNYIMENECVKPMKVEETMSLKKPLSLESDN